MQPVYASSSVCGLANTSILFMAGTIRQGQGYIYVIILTLSAILLGTRSTFAVGGASLTAVIAGYFWEQSKYVNWVTNSSSFLIDLGVLVSTLAVATYIMQFVVTMMQDSFAASQHNHERMMAEQERLRHQILKRRQTEHSLQKANEALEEALHGLERRVEKRTEQLAQANQDLETLLYVTSHDLREPLRAIQNFSQILLRRHAAEFSTPGLERLSLVSSKANRLDTLIEDILTLSRAQRLVSPDSNVSAGILVAEALQKLQKEVNETGATIIVAEEWPEMYVDQSWAIEAIYHVLLNALQYSRENDPPHIIIEAGEEPAGPHIIIRDRGIGIPANQMQDIFKLFFRADISDSGSIGAGLTLVKQIMENHNGAITIKSDTNAGTTVWLQFQPAYRSVESPIPT